MHCIHCVYGHSDVDSKDKLYTFWHVVFKPEKGIICFLTYATFICKFYIFMSFFLKIENL